MPSGVTVKFDDQLRQFFSRAELLAEAISRGLEEGAKEGVRHRHQPGGCAPAAGRRV